MTITEIEGLTAAELKSRREELVEAVADAPDLAGRYIQARTDAAVRDEKLAEQGKTISVLQKSLDEANAKVDDLKAARTHAMESVDAASQALDEANAKIDVLNNRVAHADAKAVRITDLARRRRKVLVDITAMIAPLLAAEE